MAAKPKRRTVRQLAAIRLSEMRRLADHRHRHGVEVDPDAFRFMLAATLAVGGQDGIRHTTGARFANWSGLDVTTLDSAARQCGLPSLGREDLGEIVDKACAWRDAHGRRPIGSEKAAAILLITAEERWACRIGTMGAVDETPDDRKARQKADEAERSSRRRKTAAAKPRAEYEASSLSAAKPWQAEEVSRATWYRRRETGPTTT